jgi:hypothetical protein
MKLARPLFGIGLLVLALAPLRTQAAQHSRVLLSIFTQTGHSPNVRTPPFRAPGPWRATYSFGCNMDLGMMGTDNTLSVRVVPGSSRVTNPDSSDLRVLWAYRSPSADTRSGSYTYGKGGYYRLWVEIQRSCWWSLKVYG